MDYISHEIQSRMIQDDDHIYVIEYEQTPWSPEVAEVDQTFRNGYYGIYAVAKLLPALSIPPTLCDRMIFNRKLLATTHGYHAGIGIWNHIVTQNPELQFDIEFTLSESLENDLYHGIAGDLLTAAITDNSISTDIFRIIRACLDALADPMIRPGFAHGSLGICFALLAMTNKCDKDILLLKQVRDAVSLIVSRSIEEMMNGCLDFALCSSSMTSVIVALYFDKIFSTKTLPRAKTLALVDIVNNFLFRKTVPDVPLHLCCGISGVIDILLEVAHLTGENIFQECAHEIAHRYLIESNLIQLTSTGVFHGLFGVAYQLARLDPSFSNGKVLPSLFFPSIFCNHSYGA